MTTRRRATIIAVSIVIIVCISVLVSRSLSPNDKPPDIKNPDAFVIAAQNDIASLDPAYAYDTSSNGQIENIYETLVEFDGDSTSEFVPVLATEWTISEDGKTYRFKIRDGVSFHNGNPLTPEDVEYSFERGMVQDYALGPQWMFFEPLFGLGNYTSRIGNGLIPLEHIKSKVEVDGEWVQFNLAIPYEPVLQILASRPGWVFSRDQILDYLWGHEKTVLNRTVDVHIRNLREKLGKAADLIKNVRGVGYKLEE